MLHKFNERFESGTTLKFGPMLGECDQYDNYYFPVLQNTYFNLVIWLCVYDFAQMFS